MSPVNANHQSPADTVLSGGPILTMDAAGSHPKAVALRDGRMIAVGSLDEVNGLAGQQTERVDLDGRTLLPGLIDAHMHSAMVQLADWVDVSPMSTPTADEVYTALRGATATSTGWVLAQQFDPSITEGHPRLDREILDRLVPDRPLLVLESNGHIAWVNSAALARAGVDRDTPDPPAGRYTKDEHGELTGRLEESSAVRAFTIGFPLVTGDALVGRIRNLLWHAAGQGVTLLHDCGIGSIDGATDLDGLRHAVDGESPVRYRGMLVSSAYDAWAQLGLRPGFGDDRFPGRRDQGVVRRVEPGRHRLPARALPRHRLLRVAQLLPRRAGRGGAARAPRRLADRCARQRRRRHRRHDRRVRARPEGGSAR